MHLAFILPKNRGKEDTQYIDTICNNAKYTFIKKEGG